MKTKMKKMSFKTDLRSRLMKLNRNQAHYGPPVKLFGDKDKDKVSNVFDCKPFNKKKQDVISPVGYGSPIGEMYGRQEGMRQQAAYMRQIKEAQRLEELRVAELQRDALLESFNHPKAKNFASTWERDIRNKAPNLSIPASRQSRFHASPKIAKELSRYRTVKSNDD